MIGALRLHWPEYLFEALLLGTFMVVACFTVFILEHPRSLVRRAMSSSLGRRVVIGIVMGLTAVTLIYSPMGQRSGAHMNPGTTLTFLLLAKIRGWDALFYILAQFVGGVSGVGASAAVLGPSIRHESVNYVATQPGRHGARVAWAAEFIIAFGMMGMVLLSSNNSRSAPYTGIFAGTLVAVYIAIEAPLSGMSINPARTLGSAIPAWSFRGLWVYFTAPPLAMLAAATLYQAAFGADRIYCAKLNHRGHAPCIFNCRIERMPGWNPALAGGIQQPTADDRPAR